MLYLLKKKMGGRLPEKIYCDACDCYHTPEELTLFTGRDMYEFLCPDCGMNLLPTLTEDDVMSDG